MVDLLGVRGFCIVAEPNVYPPRDAPDPERLGARRLVVEWPDPTAQSGRGYRSIELQRDSGRRWSFNQYGDPRLLRTPLSRRPGGWRRRDGAGQQMMK